MCLLQFTTKKLRTGGSHTLFPNPSHLLWQFDFTTHNSVNNYCAPRSQVSQQHTKTTSHHFLQQLLDTAYETSANSVLAMSPPGSSPTLRAWRVRKFGLGGSNRKGLSLEPCCGPHRAVAFRKNTYTAYTFHMSRSDVP